MTKQRKILVTNALPYANGHIHLGHLLGYIQADIWVRFQRMREHEVHYICGSDTHGTPIMIKAQQLGITPEALVSEMEKEQAKDFEAFHIHFDDFYTTHSPENQKFSEMIYHALKAKGDIESRTIHQAYDAVENMFLPDRYVKGTCPRCAATQQYGDNCEVCGATYSPTELKDPISVLSGTTPIEKTSEHFFFKLSHHAKQLKAWITQGHLQPEVSNKLLEWFEKGLEDWDISRDAPYFGFLIPGETSKYFYVWLDAPVGYIGIFYHYCNQHPHISFDDYWRKEGETELYHFIGKDIIYFHCLFWPALLKGANFRLPTGVYANGYLTINGKKMSKSRGTFINARDYLNHLDPDFLRYYFAAKLNPRISDLDLNLEDFIQRNNSDLIGKVVNLASRCAGFINKHFQHQLSMKDPLHPVLQEMMEAKEEIAEYYETRQYSHVVRRVMEFADKANQYIAEQQPWVLTKDPATFHQAQEICTIGLHFFRLLILYLKPIVPHLAKKSEDFLNIEPLQWKDASHCLAQNHGIHEFKPLLQRIDPAQVAMMQAEVTKAFATEKKNAGS